MSQTDSCFRYCKKLSAVSCIRTTTLQNASAFASAQYASVNGFTFTFGGLDLHLVDWNYTLWNWFTSGGIGITFATFGVNYVGQEKEAGFAS